jgi:hypothetical protein
MAMASLIQNEIVFSSSKNYDDYLVGLKTSTLKSASGEEQGAKKRPSSLGRTPSSSSKSPLFRFSLPKATASTSAADHGKEIEWIEDLVHIMTEKKLHKKNKKNQEEGTHDEDEEHPLRDLDVPSTIFIEHQDVEIKSSTSIDCPIRYKKELLLDDMGTLQEALYRQTLQHYDVDDDAESAYISEGDAEEEDDNDEHDNVVVMDYVQPLVDTTFTSKYAASKSTTTKYHKELLMDNLSNLQEVFSGAHHEFDDDLLSQGDIESVIDDDDDDDDDHTATTSSVLSDADYILAITGMNYNNASDDGPKSNP